MSKLALVVDNGPSRSDGPRVLAPGAPISPGPVPTELAALLEHGEVVVWWGRKRNMQLALSGITLGAAVVTLALVSAFAPTFWLQPFDGIAPPLLALLSPTLFVLYREWVGRATVVVTDTAIVVVDHRREAHRVPLSALQTIARDWLRGGVRLASARQRIHIPSALTEPTRLALVSRLRRRLSGASPIDDSVGWL